MKKIYLACPFSDLDKSVQENRFEAANRKAAEFMDWGHIVFSPISHSVPINKYLSPKDLNFWLRQDLPMLKMCDELWVLALPGWVDSEGVRAEMEHAKIHKIPVRILHAY